MTDADGWVEIQLTPQSEQFWRVGARGYYMVRVGDPVSGKVLGRWGSIPVNHGSNYFLFPIGESAEIHSVSLKDRGHYTLESDPDSLVSYGGGGGIFVLSMTPDDDFEGKVTLSLNVDPVLNARLTTEFLSRDQTVAEVTIRPDSFLTPDTYTISVVAMHTGAVDTLSLGVSTLVDGMPWGIPSGEWHDDCVERKRNELLSWLDTTHPQLRMKMDQKWFSYNQKVSNWEGMSWGGCATWISLSREWEIWIREVVVPQPPTRFLLRKRGQKEPVLAARKDSPKGALYEIPTSEFEF